MDELQKRVDAAFRVLSRLNALDDEAHKRWKREACTTCGDTYQNNYMKKLERVYINYKDLIEKEMQTEKPKRGRKAKK